MGRRFWYVGALVALAVSVRVTAGWAFAGGGPRDYSGDETPVEIGAVVTTGAALLLAAGVLTAGPAPLDSRVPDRWRTAGRVALLAVAAAAVALVWFWARIRAPYQV